MIIEYIFLLLHINVLDEFVHYIVIIYYVFHIYYYNTYTFIIFLFFISIFFLLSLRQYLLVAYQKL